MSRATVRETITTYLEAKGADGTIPFLVNVFGFPAKVTSEQELYPQDPGIQVGANIFVYLPTNRDRRVALGGAHGGRKVVEFEVMLRCFMLSQQPLSQDAGADNEAFLDGLDTAIRADRNAGNASQVFQWAEGTTTGGQDLEVTSYFPQSVNGLQGATLTLSDVRVTALEIIAS